MRLSELVKHCEEVHIDCNKCTCKENCENLAYDLEDISPIGIVELVKADEDIF